MTAEKYAPSIIHYLRQLVPIPIRKWLLTNALKNQQNGWHRWCDQQPALGTACFVAKIGWEDPIVYKAGEDLRIVTVEYANIYDAVGIATEDADVAEGLYWRKGRYN